MSLNRLQILEILNFNCDLSKELMLRRAFKAVLDFIRTVPRGARKAYYSETFMDAQ